MKEIATLNNEIDYMQTALRDLTVDHARMRLFLEDLIHPEGYGHAVSSEVRKKASELLHGLLA